MGLRLVSRDQQGHFRTFHAQVDRLGMLLDLVNYAVAQGHTLLGATLLDDTSAISLPLAVFNGQPLHPVPFTGPPIRFLTQLR